MSGVPVDDESLDLIATCLEPGGPDLLRTLALVDGDTHWAEPGDGPAVVADRGRTIPTRDDLIRSLVAALRNERQIARRALAAGVTHPARLLALSAAVGALCGSVIGWWLSGRAG